MMRSILAAALAALLAACGTAPKESFYTLAGPGPAAAAPTGTSQLAIYVGPVVVPESVDRTPMVVRKGANVVDIDDFHRWAEPLKTAIPRVVAEHLMATLGTPRVMASRASNAPVDYRVAIEIQRLDASFTEGSTLDALWTVTATKAGSGPPRTGRTLVTEPAPSPDHAGVAAAHSRAIGRLAADIAGAFK